MADKRSFRKVLTIQGKRYDIKAKSQEELNQKIEKKLAEVESGKKSKKSTTGYRRTITLNGKRYDIRAKSSKELEEKIYQKQKEVEEGSIRLDRKTIKLKAIYEEYFDESKRAEVKEITLKNLKTKIEKWILPEIGDKLLKNITQNDCQRVMNNMFDQGMAQDTMNKVNQLMSYLFELAIDNNKLMYNPASRVKTPKGSKSTRRKITDYERYHILRACDSSPRYVYFLAMLLCGCRPSEVAELKGADIIEAKGEHILHIRGSKTAKADRFPNIS